MIKVKKLHPGAKLPSRANPGDAGLDLSACIDASVVIEPEQWKLIPCGIAIELNPGQVGFCCSRSGLALRKGISVLNSPGVVDEPFRGEMGVVLVNHSKEPFIVNHGDRIAQLVVCQYDDEVCEWRDELSETDRGSGGFGSSGR